MSSPARRPIAVATITLVRDPQEESLLRRSMTALSGLGLPVMLTDGGSGADFAEFLRRLPLVTVTTAAGRGLVGQVRASLSACAQLGAQFILYTEPDKLAFFEQDLLSFIDRAPLNNDVGVVIAGRSKAGFESFPLFQQSTEGTINRLCSELFDLPGDYFYGPCLVHRKLVPYFDRLSAEIGWGWRPFIFAVSHRLGLRLAHVTGDYACPADQREEGETERLHRLRQLGQNVSGLLLGMTTPLERTTDYVPAASRLNSAT